MINKESKIYTIIYIIVLVVFVGSALAFVSILLKDKQQQNAHADKMRQILASVAIEAPADSVAAYYERYISDSYVVDINGNRVGEIDAFNVDIATQSSIPTAERLLPVYVCNIPESGNKYILPVYGAGLWGPIWGYISLDADGNTIYGAYFDHKGETPGLGAEIAKPEFYTQFNGKHLFQHGEFLPVTVVKTGQAPSGDEDYVDGISGGTITSKGVAAMILNSLSPYQNYLKNL